MKKYIIGLFIVFWVLQFGAFANENEVQITQNNQILLDIWKSHIHPEDIQFQTLHLTDVTVIISDNKVILHLEKYALKEDGEIAVTYKGKQKKIPVKIRYFKDEKNFDTFWDFLFLRLQNKPLSCESSAAASIISQLKERFIDENDVIQVLPKSLGDTIAKKNGKTILWGNPEDGFVWYMDNFWATLEKPSQKKLTGYGVYEKPIWYVARSFSIPTTIINFRNFTESFWANQHLSFLLNSLKNGDFVELWGDWCTSWESEDGLLYKKDLTLPLSLKKVNAKNECYDVEQQRILEWNFLDSKNSLQHQSALAGEHTFILLGWQWDIEKPEKIIVWDTDTGYHRYDTQEWMRKWKKMQYRSIVFRH